MDLKALFLKENVGGWDLFARAVIGSAAITALAIGAVPADWTPWVGIVAFVGLFTAMTRHCSPYSLINFSTVPSKRF